MSLEQLEEDGLLRPREQWGRGHARSNVAKIPLLAVAIAAVASAGLMYFGNGGRVTWIGLGLFFLALAAFTAVSLRGIG